MKMFVGLDCPVVAPVKQFARILSVLSVIAVAGLTPACGDDDDGDAGSDGAGQGGTNPDGGSGGTGASGGSGGVDAGGGSGGEGGGQPGGGDSVYVVFTTIETPSGRFGYYATTPSIEGDVTVDVRQGVEEPGGGQLYAPAEGGYFLLGGGETPTLTRYDLGEDDELEKGKTISFANLGVEGIWSTVIFAGPSQAYFLDPAQHQVIAFDPTTMLLDETIPIEGLQCEGETYFGMAIERTDGFYFPGNCYGENTNPPGVDLVHLDPETNEVTVANDTRCTGAMVGMQADDGTAYWFSDLWNSMEWQFLGTDVPHDCALRLNAADTTFDDEWELDLTTRTDGVAALAGVPAGDTEIWVKVFEESAVQGQLPADEVDWGAKAWRWGLLDVASEAGVALDESSDLVVYYGEPIVVDARAFSPASNEDFTETTLIELTRSGAKERLVVEGELRKVVRLR